MINCGKIYQIKYDKIFDFMDMKKTNIRRILSFESNVRSKIQRIHFSDLSFAL